MKIKITNFFDKNKEGFKPQDKEITIKGDCKITNYGKDYKPSSAKDLTISIMGENAEVIKGAKTHEEDKNTAHFGNGNYSIFTTIAGMSENDGVDELTIDDLLELKKNLDKDGKPTNKTLLDLGITKVLQDIENHGVVTLMIGDKVVLRIDFELDKEKEAKGQNVSNKTQTNKTQETQQQNNNEEATNDNIFQTRALEGGMNINQFANAKKYIRENFAGYELINVRRDPDQKVATLVIVDKNKVEFSIKYKDGKLVEDIAKFKNIANKGGMSDSQFSDSLDYIKTTYKNCVIKNIKQDPNAKVVTFVLNNNKEVKYIDGVLQNSKLAKNLHNEKAVMDKFLVELKKADSAHSNELSTEDFMNIRDNFKWKEWGIKDLRVDPYNGIATILLDNGIKIQKKLTKIEVNKNKDIKQNDTIKENRKDSIGFMHALSGQETRGKKNPHMVINYAGYVGLYQMGEQAMIEMGIYSKEPDGYLKNGTPYYNNDWSGTFQENDYKIKSLWDYRNHPEKQEALQIDYKKRDWKYIKNLKLDKYIGKIINGQKITAAGLLAGAHLVGVGGLQEYLKGNYAKADGSGTPVSLYIKQFAGFDVSGITG